MQGINNKYGLNIALFVTCNYIECMAQTTAERQRERRKRLREEGRVKAEYWPLKENKKALDNYAAKLEGETS